ncbi:MAG TPA: aminofutalosine synthase MqnE [Bacteroidales bacterium]|nr:aminofutalosine synthase MqnE [Bacteroidales bacterium]HPS15926.1 aminofutalosine synthase MqnE [Bacteroidales bacterium]
MNLAVINNSLHDNQLKIIADKVFSSQRINTEEGLLLYEKADLGFLGLLADFIRKKKNGDNTYFIKNIHIEPTNICIYNCRFCSYSRKAGEPGSWEMSIVEILQKIKSALSKKISEIHIVGGVHPDKDLDYYSNLISKIREIAPNIHIKAFTAIELDYMFSKSGKTYIEGFEILKKSGLNSIPGGGAEIFSEEIRNQICENKSAGTTWLKIHEAAHNCGIPSNATMLYGHIENYSHRIAHLDKLRELQDKTNLFNAFIPLKYRNKNNKLNLPQEISVTEDLRNYAVCRIFLDNFPHLKAYWPMIGKATTQLSLSFGVDDIDGTIEDSTKIYSMAGVEDKNPTLTKDEMIKIISDAKKIPVERDSLYNPIK